MLYCNILIFLSFILLPYIGFAQNIERGWQSITLDISNTKLDSLCRNNDNIRIENLQIFSRHIGAMDSENLDNEYYLSRYFNINIPAEILEKLKSESNLNIKVKDFSASTTYPFGDNPSIQFIFNKIRKITIPGTLLNLQGVKEVTFWQHQSFSQKNVFMVEFFLNDGEIYEQRNEYYRNSYGPEESYMRGKMYFLLFINHWDKKDVSTRLIKVQEAGGFMFNNTYSLVFIDLKRLDTILNYLNTLFNLAPELSKAVQKSENKLKLESIRIDKDWSWHNLQSNDPYYYEGRSIPFYYPSFALVDIFYYMAKQGCICNNEKINEIKKKMQRNIEFFEYSRQLDINEERFALNIINNCQIEMPRIIKWIKRKLEYENRMNLIPYINSDSKFCSLKFRRPDIFNSIFTPTFIKSMKEENPILFNEWIKCCVGFADPVFLITLLYNGDKNTRLEKVIYNVLKIDQVMGGGGVLDLPIASYIHELEYKEGQQIRILEPSILVNAQSQGSIFTFRLMLTPKFDESIKDKIGRVWVFTMTLTTTNGYSCTSHPIALIMSRFD